jgi:menaquinone-dependent protoporphyrinogen oxidase
MSKALIIYGTRSGTTASTAQIIGETLQKEGLNVKVVDAKEEKNKDISEYDLIVVGSGIQMGKWVGEPDDFLKKHQKELAAKKLALFVCCGSAKPLSEGEKKAQEFATGKQKYLDEKATQYGLKPVALGYFGACYDFNKMGWLFRKTLSSMKPQLEAASGKPTQDGVYDLRDLDEVRAWAKELAK